MTPLTSTAIDPGPTPSAAAGRGSHKRRAARVLRPVAPSAPPAASAGPLGRPGAAVRRERERLGWSQLELARRAGTSRSWLQRFEQGLRAAEARQLGRLWTALGAGERLAERDPLGKCRSPITLPEHRAGKRPPNAGRRFPPEPLTEAEITALLDAMGDGKAAVRDRALILVLWRCGLRIAEALALACKDVDLERGMISVLHGKGDRWRVVAIDAGAVTYLKRWLALRDQLGLPDGAPLFCTITQDALGPGRPLASQAFRNALKTYARRAGIRKRVHPHGLRHTHAFELSMEGIPIQVIRAQLGHTDLAMTAHYIDHLAPLALIRALRDRQLPAGLMPAAPTAVLSQGQPAPEPSTPPIPHRVLAGDPTTPAPVSPAEHDGLPRSHLQRVLDLLAANGGRASQAQITRALALPSGRISKLVHKLERQGLIVGGGYAREAERAGAATRIWRLAPPRARFTIDEPHDPRERPGSTARPGYGPQRVLELIVSLGGSASQAQLGRRLGVGADTIARHCQALERAGAVVRGGLDKSTSNRGSQVWALPEPAPSYSAAHGWRQIRVPLRHGPA